MQRLETTPGYCLVVSIWPKVSVKTPVQWRTTRWGSLARAMVRGAAALNGLLCEPDRLADTTDRYATSHNDRLENNLRFPWRILKHVPGCNNFQRWWGVGINPADQ